ncbi:hypothetical protein B0H14DRAFT_2566273 [Mycena olivaceomarginata]|nr:hypothetical protein B0H14DRAFT_2566273 [Mycena olivaceomarginata]
MSFTPTHRWYSVAAQEAVFERSMHNHFKNGNWSRDQIIQTGQIERWHKAKLAAAKAIDRIKYYIYHLHRSSQASYFGFQTKFTAVGPSGYLVDWGHWCEGPRFPRNLQIPGGIW